MALIYDLDKEFDTLLSRFDEYLNAYAYVTIREYAKKHGVSPMQIRVLIQCDKLKAYKIGEVYYIHKATPYPVKHRKRTS